MGVRGMRRWGILGGRAGVRSRRGTRRMEWDCSAKHNEQREEGFAQCHPRLVACMPSPSSWSGQVTTNDLWPHKRITFCGLLNTILYTLYFSRSFVHSAHTLPESCNHKDCDTRTLHYNTCFGTIDLLCSDHVAIVIVVAIGCDTSAILLW